jgi:hypothetical protein
MNDRGMKTKQNPSFPIFSLHNGRRRGDETPSDPFHPNHWEVKGMNGKGMKTKNRGKRFYANLAN